MTIRRGKLWGCAKPLPNGAPVARSNAALRRLVTEQSEAGTSPAPIGLCGGDLWHVVGSPEGGLERLQSEDAHTVPIDLIRVQADETTLWACAHVIARNSWWSGPIVAAMNAERAGGWRLAPAAHPNDGRLHVVQTGVDGAAALSFGQRLLARRRLGAGTHVPHPAIELRRVEQAEFSFERPTALWLDGERVAKCRTLKVSIEPDAATVVF